MEFNVENPPESFKKFRKQVLGTIEGVNINLDEPYPIALFVVTRDDQGLILELDDIADEVDLDDVDMDDLEFVMEYLYPAVLRKKSGIFFGVVFPGTRYTTDNEQEILVVLTGSPTDIDMVASEIDRDEEYQEATLGPWEKVEVEGFPEIVVPYRRAVTLQG